MGRTRNGFASEVVRYLFDRQSEKERCVVKKLYTMMGSWFEKHFDSWVNSFGHWLERVFPPVLVRGIVLVLVGCLIAMMVIRIYTVWLA